MHITVDPQGGTQTIDAGEGSVGKVDEEQRHCERYWVGSAGQDSGAYLRNCGYRQD